MGIEELIKALGLEGEAAEKLRTFVTDRDKASKTKLDKVTEKLTAAETEKKMAEAEKQKLMGLAKKIGFDVTAEDFDSAVDAAIEDLKKASGNPTPEELSKLKKEISTLRKDHEKLSEEKTKADQMYGDIKGKYHGGLIKSALQNELAKANVNSPDFYAEALSGKVRVNDDDTLTYIGKDGAEMEIADGVAVLVKDHPDFVANTQNGGVGSAKGNGANGAKNGIDPLIQKMIDGNKTSGEASKTLDSFFN